MINEWLTEICQNLKGLFFKLQRILRFHKIYKIPLLVVNLISINDTHGLFSKMVQCLLISEINFLLMGLEICGTMFSKHLLSKRFHIHSSGVTFSGYCLFIRIPGEQIVQPVIRCASCHTMILYRSNKIWTLGQVYRGRRLLIAIRLQNLYKRMVNSQMNYNHRLTINHLNIF